TWGGETLNTLLAALFARAAPKTRFVSTMMGVDGRVSGLDTSIAAIRRLAQRTQSSDDMPLDVAGKFANASRFMSELSPSLAAREKRRSIPWETFFRWIDRITAINTDVSVMNGV